MGALAFGGGYFGQYASGGTVGITLTLMDPIHTGHIAYGDQGANGFSEQGEISDTVGGTLEELDQEVMG